MKHKNMCKTIFERNIYVLSKFSCLHSSHDLCADAHSLEGTLLVICEDLSTNFILLKSFVKPHDGLRMINFNIAHLPCSTWVRLLAVVPY